jgi:hypothetical protein
MDGVARRGPTSYPKYRPIRSEIEDIGVLVAEATHMVDPKALAPVLAEFFSRDTGPRQ